MPDIHDIADRVEPVAHTVAAAARLIVRHFATGPADAAALLAMLGLDEAVGLWPTRRMEALG